MREDFRPILGYEGHYEINSEGVVVSIKFGKRKILKSRITHNGYQQICLRVNSVGKGKGVHRLVWEAFNGEIAEGLHVLHGEGSTRDNCCLENLSVGTISDNNGRDRRRDGTIPKGERNGRAKLTEVQVQYIKSRIRDNQKLRSLAELLQVSQAVISLIKHGHIWSHVT